MILTSPLIIIFQFILVGRTKTQEIKLTLPEASFESTQESTIQVIKSKESKNYEDEEEEEKSVSDNKNKYLLSDRNSSIRNDKDASLLSSDRKQEKQMNKLIEFEEQKQQNKNLETLSSTKGEHLLSKGKLYLKLLAVKLNLEL